MLSGYHKLVPVQDMKLRGEVKLQLHSLTLSRCKAIGQSHAPTTLPPEKEPPDSTEW
jgi:hypothetical protein